MEDPKKEKKRHKRHIDVITRSYIERRDDLKEQSDVKSLEKLKYPHSCYICFVNIPTRLLHTGHNLSEKREGNDQAHNLRLLCSSCNCSLGRQTIDEYILTNGIWRTEVNPYYHTMIYRWQRDPTVYPHPNQLLPPGRIYKKVNDVDYSFAPFDMTEDDYKEEKKRELPPVMREDPPKLFVTREFLSTGKKLPPLHIEDESTETDNNTNTPIQKMLNTKKKNITKAKLVGFVRYLKYKYPTMNNKTKITHENHIKDVDRLLKELNLDKEEQLETILDKLYEQELLESDGYFYYPTDALLKGIISESPLF